MSRMTTMAGAVLQRLSLWCLVELVWLRRTTTEEEEASGGWESEEVESGVVRVRRNPRKGSESIWW
ncbi:hypothetical protein Hanom_Chr10g00891241 [Helianthus anomalus]